LKVIISTSSASEAIEVCSHAVVQHLVVHLVGIDDQVMLAGDVDDFVQQVIRIQRAGRVVRVDDDDGAVWA
jgi:hypothetical protein